MKIRFMLTRILSLLLILLFGVAGSPALAQQSSGTLVIGMVGSPITGNFDYFSGLGYSMPMGLIYTGPGYFEPMTDTWYPLFTNFTIGPMVNTTYGQLFSSLGYTNYTGHLPSWIPALNQSVTLYKWINFSIIQGARFSDGEPVTAKDFVLRMDLTEAPGHPDLLPGDNVGVKVGECNFTPGAVDWATQGALYWYAPNNYTVSLCYVSTISAIRNFENQAPMPWNIFHVFKNGTALHNFVWKDPIGAGPWVLRSWTSNSMTFTLNPYWKTPVPTIKEIIGGEYADGPINWQKVQPSVKVLVIDVFQSVSSAELALESGDIQALIANIPNINTVWSPSIKPTEKTWQFTQVATVWLALNELVYPFNLTQFRQAIAYAINKTYITEVGEVGYGTPATSVGLPISMYNKYLRPETKVALNPYQTNITKSKDLLKSIGFSWNSAGQLLFPNGSIAPSYTLMVPTSAPDWETDALIIAGELQPLGISITVQPLTTTLIGHYQGAGYYQMMILEGSGFTPWSLWQWVMNPDWMVTYGTVSVHFPLSNNTLPTSPPHADFAGDFVRYWNVEMANLFWKTNLVIPSSERLADFNRMAIIVNRDLPLIPLFNPLYTLEYSTAQWTGWHTIENVYNMTPAGWNDFGDFMGFVALFLKPVVPTYSVSIVTAPSGGSVIIN
ncbi:MAG: ABC transporter substrate-binding protein, partial [Thermoprotei archaeon]